MNWCRIKLKSIANRVLPFRKTYFHLWKQIRKLIIHLSHAPRPFLAILHFASSGTPWRNSGASFGEEENPTIVATSVSGARWCESRGSWARPGPCRSPLSYTLDPFSLTHFFTFIYKQIGVLFKINLDCKSRWLWIFFWITWSAQFNFFIFSWPYFIS